MQYNFPLLPGLPAQWRERLRLSVEALGDDNFDDLRPAFRSDHRALTHAAAQWMGTDPDRTFLTEGGHHGILLSLFAINLAGRPLAVDAAAYTGALEQARALGSPILSCDIDEQGMTPESLRDLCIRAAAEGKPVRAAFLIPTVHNPLGCVATLERREALIAVAREFDLLFIEDDAYAYMAPDAPPSLATLAPERTFYIRGLSKIYAPATRTGFLVVPERCLAAMPGAIKNITTGVSLVHARAAISLLVDGTINHVIAEKNAEGTIRNAAARSLLGDENCWPGAPAAWHLWLKLPAHITPQEFEQRLQARGVLLSGGNWFAAGPNAPNGCRIALGGEVSRERALEGVALIAEELASF